jgi:AraC-like DNA-binding protein
MHNNMCFTSKTIEGFLSANPNLTLQDISHLIGVNRQTIEGVVREDLGFGFRELKKRSRLKRAAALLLDKQKKHTVKETAASVGLTPNALSRFIKKMTGYSPTALRATDGN